MLRLVGLPRQEFLRLVTKVNTIDFDDDAMEVVYRGWNDGGVDRPGYTEAVIHFSDRDEYEQTRYALETTGCVVPLEIPGVILGEKNSDVAAVL